MYLMFYSSKVLSIYVAMYQYGGSRSIYLIFEIIDILGFSI